MTVAALEQAITFISRTDLIEAARQQPLPAGVTDLLKISSGDHEALLAAQESSRHSQEDVRHAAEFYVQQILFSPASDHYRVLGVDPDDAEAKIKLHYRLLVRWLHPDKNSSDWEVVFSERVNRAWQALRTPERRRTYDEELLSAENPSDKSLVASREVKPAQWRESKNETRFMSARTVQRLPIAVFSLLGVGALLTLLWFSQMQPVSHTPAVIADKSEPASIPATAMASTPNKAVDTSAIPEPPNGAIIEPVSIAPPAAKPPVEIVPATVAVPKEVAPVIAAAEIPVSASSRQKPKMVEKTLPTPAIKPAVLIAGEEKPRNKNARKNKTAATAPFTEAAAPTITPTPSPALAEAGRTSQTQNDATSDASVKQFLQRFSRVYADGDYFALHNLFTQDLSIISAPPQRNVLHSYRQLFENSQSREITLDHITWLASDERIVVIASYQAQVLPRGKSDTKSSRGDIRLDLRVENGQLKIISLQSDTKNG